MFAVKSAGQRIVVGLGDHTVPGPLPELGLRGPKLFPVATDDERCFLFPLFLFIFVGAHLLVCN